MYYTGYRGDIIMRFDTLEVKDKTGQTIVLRNAEESDAEDLIKYLRITTGETPLYQKYCGRGICKIMLKTILYMARNLGYEQAELEVAAGNERAISLYKNLGFEKYGVFPNNMKYANGQYTDSYWMMKKL